MDQLEKIYDKRLISRKMDKGLLTQEQYREHINQLPDVESESEELMLDREEEEVEEVDGEAGEESEPTEY